MPVASGTSPYPVDAYLIWSNQHRAWWRADARGYTAHLDAAGRYSRDQALAHCRGRDQECGQPLPELPIRVADIFEVIK